MKTIKYFAVLVAALISTNMFAQKIVASDVTIAQGKTADVTFTIKGTEKAALAEFFLTLPEGVTIQYDADEEMYMATKISGMTYGTHTVGVTKRDDGSFYVLVQNQSGREFKAAEGDYLTITLEAAPDASLGLKTGEMTGIGLFALNTNQMNTEKTGSFKITVTDPSGIDAITVDDIENAKVYTVGGQRVDGKTAKKGVYVVNGKKMIIK
jgi:hypothetical protein